MLRQQLRKHYLDHPNNLVQLRRRFFGYLLEQPQNNKESDPLWKLYTHNHPKGKKSRSINTLDMMDYLAKLPSIAYPPEFTPDKIILNDIAVYRAINKLISLNTELVSLKKKRKPAQATLNKIDAIEAEINKYLFILHQKSDGASYADFTLPNPAQKFVDALRKQDYVKLNDLVKYIEDKYLPIVNESMGADLIHPLLEHELSKTDIRPDDLRQLKIFLELLFFLKLDSGALGYNLTSLCALIPRVLACKEITLHGFMGNMDINNRDVYQDFLSRLDGLESNPDFSRHVFDIENKTAPAIDNFIDAIQLPLAFIDALFEAKYNLTFISYLLHKVPFEDRDNIINAVVSPQDKSAFKIKLYEQQIREADSIVIKQKALYLDDAFRQRAKEIDQQLLPALPTNYLEYLQRKVEFAMVPGYVPENQALRECQKSIAGDEIGIPINRTQKILSGKIKTDILAYKALKDGDKTKAKLDADFHQTILPALVKNRAAIVSKKANAEFDFDDAAKQKMAQNKTQKQLIANIRQLIEDKEMLWKVGPFGSGKTITIDGRHVKVPSNVAKIYKLCKEAEKDGTDLAKIYKEIVSTGAKASHSFAFFRHKETQQFYDHFKHSDKAKKPRSR